MQVANKIAAGPLNVQAGRERPAVVQRGGELGLVGEHVGAAAPAGSL